MDQNTSSHDCFAHFVVDTHDELARLQERLDQAKLESLKEKYAKWKSGQIKRFQLGPRKYHNMMHKFVRAGLHVQRKNRRCGLTVKKGKTQEETLRNKRLYMQAWRSKHPGYNSKHMKAYYAKHKKKENATLTSFQKSREGDEKGDQKGDEESE